MQVYTTLTLPFAGSTNLVGEVVLRAGDGCFGLAIQDYRAVQAYLTLPAALSA
jgi:hypothetical protein